MNCADCISRLDAYVDGELAATEARALDVHFAGCERCRGELASLRALLTQTAALPKEILPKRNLWAEISASVAPETIDGRAGSPALPRASRSRVMSSFVPLAFAASIAVLLTWGERLGRTRSAQPRWSVITLAGAPRVDERAIAGESTLSVGQWLETDATSRAEVTTGAVGRVTVDRNSRVRLATANTTDHRLELQRGALSAFIWAPPRIFFVDTPSATAIDLGCAYTLEVNDAGDGELIVTLGYVALEHGGRESIIPSGAMCLTRRAAGPGTPFAQDANPALRAALQEFDFGGGGSAALQRILTSVRSEDGVTLWHLLARARSDERAQVYDALARDHAPPAGVTRAGILAGDVAMRTAWGESLGIGTFGRP